MAQTAVAVLSPTNEGLKSKAEEWLALCGNPVTEQRSAFSAALSRVTLAWAVARFGLLMQHNWLLTNLDYFSLFFYLFFFLIPSGF